MDNRDSSAVLVESAQSSRQVYIDKENNLPIRFEAYDWPKGGKAPDLMEEYTYSDLRVNVGLTPRDFDPANKSYSFGRF